MICWMLKFKWAQRSYRNSFNTHHHHFWHVTPSVSFRHFHHSSQDRFDSSPLSSKSSHPPSCQLFNSPLTLPPLGHAPFKETTPFFFLTPYLLLSPYCLWTSSHVFGNIFIGPIRMYGPKSIDLCPFSIRQFFAFSNILY